MLHQTIAQEEISSGVRTFLKEEELGAARYFGTFSELIYGERDSYAFLGLYMYVRYLDDAVDERQQPCLTRNLLLGEITTLLRCDNPENIGTFNPGYVIVENPINEKCSSESIPITSTQYDEIQYMRKLLQWGLLNTDPDVLTKVQHYLIEGLRGFYLENEYIDLGKPVPDELREYRNHRALTVYFQIASLVLWGKEIGDETTVKKFDKFINWAVKADILNDLYIDLANGVIPFDTELIQKFNIKLNKGEKIPPEMEELWYYLKKDVVANSITSLKESMAPDFPLYTKLLFLVYFLYKYQKIVRSSHPVEDHVFCENKL